MFRVIATLPARSAATLKHRATTTRLVSALSGWTSLCCRHISSSSSSLGLLASEEMTRTDGKGFHLLTERVLKQSQDLVDKIRSAPPGVEIVQMFDVLSDRLCQVADLAECLRNLHPNRKVVAATHESITMLSEYIEVLNTDEGLYRSLDSVLSTPALYQALDPVTQRVGHSFMHDFLINGINLDHTRRQRVVQLHGDILEAGHTFATHSSPDDVILPKSDLPEGLHPQYALLLPTHPDRYHLQFSTAAALLQCSARESTRSTMYRALNAVVPSQVEVLERLVSRRHELAVTVGQPSFCHLAMQRTMVGSPEKLLEFLKALTSANRSHVERELESLRQLKVEESGDSSARIEAWDVDYFLQKASASIAAVYEDKSSIEEYFSFEVCLKGLGHLYSSLYGIRLVEEESKGFFHLWHGSVKCIRVEHESEGLMGYILGDFFDRRGDKNYPNCHFTLRGGRVLEDGSYQSPVIAICCDFPPSPPHLMSLDHVESFFHEMGHALHTMLGRTRYQQVTGTRCSLDFAEVPSTLNEMFLRDARVLKSIGRHHSTGAPIPDGAVSALLRQGSSFPAVELQKQILDSAFDAVLHLSQADQCQPATAVCEKVVRDYGLVPHVPNTAWFLHFTHLHAYGSMYYSYLWAKAIARLIWKDCFVDNPFSRSAGEAYRSRVLAHGGEFPPSQLVAGLLGYQPGVDDLVNSLINTTRSEQL